MSLNIPPTLTNILTAKQSILKYLPPYSKHLCQPVDMFIISKIKDAWSKQWKVKKTEFIASNAWQDSPKVNGQWSGKISDYFCANSVKDENRKVDSNNMSYTRKAMIYL